MDYSKGSSIVRVFQQKRKFQPWSIVIYSFENFSKNEFFPSENKGGITHMHFKMWPYKIAHTQILPWRLRTTMATHGS